MIQEQLADEKFRWISEIRLASQTSIFVDCPTLVRFSKATEVNSPIQNSATSVSVYLDINQLFDLMQEDGYEGDIINMMNDLEVHRFNRLEEQSTTRYTSWDTLTFTSKNIIQRVMVDNILRLDMKISV